jgi:hypothetical protein
VYIFVADLTRKGNYIEALQFNTEHPNKDCRNAIESLEHAGDEQPPDATTLPLPGDETTWKRGSLNGRIKADEDPPLEEESAAAATTTEHSGASLLAKESGGDTTPSLRNRRRENRL